MFERPVRASRKVRQELIAHRLGPTTVQAGWHLHILFHQVVGGSNVPQHVQRPRVAVELASGQVPVPIHELRADLEDSRAACCQSPLATTEKAPGVLASVGHNDAYTSSGNGPELPYGSLAYPSSRSTTALAWTGSS